MQIRTFYGSKSLWEFLLYDLGDENAPVCEIWCFYHNPNTLVDFWTLAPLLLTPGALCTTISFLVRSGSRLNHCYWLCSPFY